MGYCMTLRDANFKMKGKKKEEALENLKIWASKMTHIAWSSPHDIMQADTLKDALSELGWDIDEEEVTKVDTEGLLLRAKMLSNSLHDSKVKKLQVSLAQISLSREVADGIAKLDSQGDVFGISFNGEKIGDEEAFFDVIAPYVEEGSYIEMSGEDGSIWRWVFTKEGVQEKSAQITF